MSTSSDLTIPRSRPHIRLNSAPEDLIDQKSPDGKPSQRQPAPRPILTKAFQSASSLRSPSLVSHADWTDSPITEGLTPPQYRSTSQHGSPTDSRPGSRSGSPLLAGSRRSSWASDLEQGYNPKRVRSHARLLGSGASSLVSSDDDGVNTQTVSEKFAITPGAGLLLFPEEVEKDDWLHNPVPGEKEPRDCDVWTNRGIKNVGALGLITIGLFAVFIIYPVLTFTQQYRPPGAKDLCAEDPRCISGDLPLLKNVRHSAIDPDTPEIAYTKVAVDGSTLNLVFSDEFNKDGRSFYDEDDPYFQAVDLWYGVTQDLEWYDPDAVTTKDGALHIRFDAFQNHGLNYRSGMLQSWNKMCFKGGHMEASISLPGAGDTIGFWPGFWAMGNLGRPGYAATTDGLWPYSYWNECDLGITKNQSSPDGVSALPGMRLPACPCNNEDHPSPGRSRSAPEIDALEASVAYLNPPAGAAIGSVSQSFQVAPFDIWYQPDADFFEVYDNSITSVNAYRGSVYQQAVSSLTNLNNDWYNGKAYQTYGFEYTPGATGAVTWFVGEDKTWHVDGRALGPNGNVGQRVLPEEPLSMVVNFGMSESFSQLNYTGLAKLMPATMRIDYIRIYQSDDDVLSCDPPGYETTEYIKQHPKAYLDRERTRWSQTGYKWPKNTFVDKCAAEKVPN